MTPTRDYFDSHARTFDRLYAGRSFRASPRRALERRQRLAVAVVARHPGAEVLDVGCGSGRVAEAVIAAGAAAYVGIDLSSQMLALARRRLARHDAVELIEGNFLDLEIPRTFDVVLALGLFDYLADPLRAAAWLRPHCDSTLVASFTRWDWVKAPLRHLHYEVLHRCPVFDYTEARAHEFLDGAGFSSVEFAFRGPRGFLVLATP
jgi:SAM-dependent methyltransferase